VNIIEGYRVVTKFQIGLPAAFVGIFACPNSNCISHSEPVSSRFYVSSNPNQVQLRCHFCERTFSDSLFKH
jgi:aspartate carbamoyltransferase regulatory subunit